MFVFLTLAALLILVAELPLENGQVSSTCRNQVVALFVEFNVGYVGRVAVVFLESGFFNGARVAEKLYHTEVVGCGKNLLARMAVDGVNVRTVSARWEDTLDWPTKW